MGSVLQGQHQQRSCVAYTELQTILGQQLLEFCRAFA